MAHWQCWRACVLQSQAQRQLELGLQAVGPCKRLVTHGRNTGAYLSLYPLAKAIPDSSELSLAQRKLYNVDV